ncbi:hypothetical protein ACLI4Y_17070 [Natrialbaceae archaeon A-CW3]
MDDPNDDLAAAIRELTATLELLREELTTQGPRRPPLRPPTPRELTRFGDEIAIPALIALLEANVRALKALQRGLKVARVERDAKDAAGDAADRTKRRSSELRKTTLSHLDSALNELQDAVSSDSIDADERTKTLLEDAQRLRADLDQRLSSLEAETRSRENEFDGSVTRIDIESEPDDTTDGVDQRSNTADVDVDAELETLKDQYASSSDETPDSEESDGNGDDSGSSASADDGDGVSNAGSNGDNDDDDDNGGGTEDDDADTSPTGSR